MEQKIISQFLYNHKLKFNEIEKGLKIRSNKLSYYIKKLKEKGILVKEKDFYKLSETAENLIPYLSKKKNMLSVILIHIGNGKNCLLYQRKKRPFKDLLGLPGGRIILEETIKDTVKRIMKEKHNINAKLKKIHSISIEHIKNSEKIIQSDLIIFVTATTKDFIELTDIEKNKSKIISSDYKLVKKHLDKEIKIEKFLTLH
jgi:ADP-ribose pyrophosphatase YjhB (NUDIX family)|tara:strand:- start:531 stop:1133 length:603 start_codon:yes stop_codon:yes gene_type:complete